MVVECMDEEVQSLVQSAFFLSLYNHTQSFKWQLLTRWLESLSLVGIHLAVVGFQQSLRTYLLIVVVELRI
jgi:hypothetical protein